MQYVCWQGTHCGRLLSSPCCCVYMIEYHYHSTSTADLRAEIGGLFKQYYFVDRVPAGHAVSQFLHVLPACPRQAHLLHYDRTSAVLLQLWLVLQCRKKCTQNC